jgi:hypothetical protein
VGGAAPPAAAGCATAVPVGRATGRKRWRRLDLSPRRQRGGSRSRLCFWVAGAAAARVEAFGRRVEEAHVAEEPCTEEEPCTFGFGGEERIAGGGIAGGGTAGGGAARLDCRGEGGVHRAGREACWSPIQEHWQLGAERRAGCTGEGALLRRLQRFAVRGISPESRVTSGWQYCSRER